MRTNEVTNNKTFLAQLAVRSTVMGALSQNKIRQNNDTASRINGGVVIRLKRLSSCRVVFENFVAHRPHCLPKIYTGCIPSVDHAVLIPQWLVAAITTL